MRKLQLAILDMYNNTPNQGMRCIKDLAARFNDQIELTIFDVRGKAEVPNLDFDLYISTGGPGDPREGDGHWDTLYFEWLQSVWEWNKLEVQKKHVFFICHSFQMAVLHFGIAEVNKRKSMSFGTFPIHLTDSGIDEILFEGLGNPFWAADFRYFQVVQPNLDRCDEMGIQLLAFEKIRPHVPLERAVMAMRFSPEMMGVQFHPEADSEGMIAHFIEPERREAIMKEYGAAKYHQMLTDLRHPKRISFTYDHILPAFFSQVLMVHQTADAACAL